MYCEEYEAVVGYVEEDAVVYVLALVVDFEPPDLSFAGYVFDLWMVPGFGEVVLAEFLDCLGNCFLYLVSSSSNCRRNSGLYVVFDKFSNVSFIFLLACFSDFFKGFL
nr:hypothetical protein [Halorubrum sp. CBA1125]